MCLLMLSTTRDQIRTCNKILPKATSMCLLMLSTTRDSQHRYHVHYSVMLNNTHTHTHIYIQRERERPSPKLRNIKNTLTCRIILPCQKDPYEYAEQGEQNRYEESRCNPIDHFHTTKHNKAQDNSHNNPINLQVMWTWTFYPLKCCHINICDSLCINNKKPINITRYNFNIFEWYILLICAIKTTANNLTIQSVTGFQYTECNC